MEGSLLAEVGGAEVEGGGNPRGSATLPCITADTSLRGTSIEYVAKESIFQSGHFLKRALLHLFRIPCKWSHVLVAAMRTLSHLVPSLVLKMSFWLWHSADAQKYAPLWNSTYSMAQSQY